MLGFLYCEFLLACVLFIKLSFKKERRALKLTKVRRAREDFQHTKDEHIYRQRIKKKNRKILKIEEKKRQIDLGPLLVSVPLPDLPKNLHWNLDFLNSGISLHSFSLLKNFFSVAKAIPIPLPFSKRIMLSVGCVLFLYQLTDAIQPHLGGTQQQACIAYMSGVVGLAALFILPGFAHKSEGQLTISQSRVASAGTTVETGHFSRCLSSSSRPAQASSLSDGRGTRASKPQCTSVSKASTVSHLQHPIDSKQITCLSSESGGEDKTKIYSKRYRYRKG